MPIDGCGRERTTGGAAKATGNRRGGIVPEVGARITWRNVLTGRWILRLKPTETPSEIVSPVTKIQRLAVPFWARILLRVLVAIVLYLGAQPAANWISFRVLGLPHTSHAGEAVAFFFMDVPKLLLLLAATILVVSVVQSSFTPQRARRLLGGKHTGFGNVIASLLGMVTPFCSCSAVPLFISFVESGIPLSVTFSFLVAAPVVNKVALVLLFAIYGWWVAALYAVSGVVMSILIGLVIGWLHVERYIVDFVGRLRLKEREDEVRPPTWETRVTAGFEAARLNVARVWPHVLVGVAVGAGIRGYIPTDALFGYMNKDAAWWSVPVVVLMALPLYANAAAVVPVVQALVGKGAALGTGLAFMMAATGVSLPAAIMLRRVMKPQLIALFIGMVTLAIIMTGYIFNLVM